MPAVVLQQEQLIGTVNTEAGALRVKEKRLKNSKTPGRKHKGMKKTFTVEDWRRSICLGYQKELAQKQTICSHILIMTAYSY